MTKCVPPARLHLAPVLLAITALLLSACGGSEPGAIRRSSSTAPPSGAETVTTPSPAQGGTGPSPQVVNVVSAGADPTGARDSTAAIGTAITEAESQPGSEVYFPPGRYLLDDPVRNQVDFTIDRPIRLIGAGPSRTVIVNELGARDPAAPVATTVFEIVTNRSTGSGAGDGTTISGMTIDAATYDAGTPIMDFANHTTISDLVVDAPRSTNTYNPNAFGIRVIAVCNPSDRSRIFRTGNLVEDVTIDGSGMAGQTELDLSCQRDTTVDDVTIHGNGLDVFYCDHDTLENLNLVGSPVPAGQAPSYTWVVTGSYDITFENVHTTGSGGVIAPDVRDVTRNLLVENETMTGTGSFMSIGDSLDTTIENSHLLGIRLDPKRSLVGLDVEHTSYAGVSCPTDGQIEGLSGIACP